MQSWIEEELGQAQFDDKRLNDRFLKIATDLADNPSKSIHSASINWAASKAAYRFFDNEDINSQKILKPHYEATRLRCSNYDRIIVAQDTTYIDYSKHSKTKGLGNSFKTHGKEIKGVCQHVGLAMTPKGLPLGLTYNKLWNRKDIKQSSYERDSLPLQLKESYRWIECLRKTKELLVNEEIIVVSDREGDIYEGFEEAYELGVDVVVRCQHDRIVEGDVKISEVLATSKLKGKHKVIIPSNGSRKRKVLNLELRSEKLELKSKPSDQTTHMNRHRKDLELYVIDASDVKAEVNWRILTTLPVSSSEDIKEILDIYAKRWNVELYFKSLKTGCNVEDCRMNEASKLVKYLSLMSIIAWRVFWINFVGRESPESCCETTLVESEWKVAWLMVNRDKIKKGQVKKSEMPKDPPKLRESIHWIAAIGGFKRRKSDGEPGLISFWRGWRKLQNGVEVYEMFNE
jgi:hypothetical protein